MNLNIRKKPDTKIKDIMILQNKDDINEVIPLKIIHCMAWNLGTFSMSQDPYFLILEK